MWRKPVETPKEKRLRIVTSVLWATLIIWAIVPGSTVIYKAEAEVEPPKTDKEMIIYYANIYGSDPQMIYDVYMAESNGNCRAVGDGGRAKSCFQYFPETWERYSKKFNQTFGTNERFDIHSLHDNVKLTSWVFSLGETEKSEWTTYVCFKKGGVYKFYSRVNKKSYILTCNAEKHNL